MTFYKINFIIYYDQSEYFDNLSYFVTKLLNTNTHYILYLRVEYKSGCIKITGYSLSSLLNNSVNINDLWLYIHNALNMFIEKIYSNTINEVKNDYKHILCINCFGKFISTYY